MDVGLEGLRWLRWGMLGGLPGTRLGIAAAVAAVVMVGGYGAELARGAVGDKPPGPSRPAVEYDPLRYPFTTASDSPVSEPGKVPHGELMRQAREQAAKQLIEHQARERVRRSQARGDARRASRTKYAGLSRDGAARLAHQTFPTLVSGPTAGALSSGRRADHYVDAFTASVKGAAPDGGDAVVVSSTPLRAKDAGGKLAPVDVTLEQVGDGWAAANPLEEYRIGPQADDGVDFPHLGLAIRPVENAADGDRAGKTVFFADSLTDTDTMVKPLTSGVQYAWQLRSKHAPERLSLHVDLPAGATLGQPGRDGVRVVEGGKTIARLGIATAFDADGEIVPTRLEVNGDRITIVIEHVGRDVAYPIAVDPDFVAGFYFSYSGYDAFSYWGSYNQSGKYTVFGGDFWWGRGLYILSHSYPQEPTPYLFTGGGPGTADRAGFYFNAPGNAHIWRAYSSVSRHILGASLAHCIIVGIAGPDLNNWEGPYGTTYGEGCAPFALYSWNVTTPGQGGTASNAFVFGNYAYSSNQVAVDSYMGDVELWMSDPDAPHGPPGYAGPMVMAPAVYPAWITNPADPISAVAKDDSSGIASITFYGPAGWTYNGMNGSSGITVNNPACAYGVCSKQFTAAVPIGNMPDGHQVIWAYARDASGQWSPVSYPYDMNFDLVPPPTPQGVSSAGFDASSSAATMAIEPGRDDPDGEVRTQVSPLDVVKYRWKRPNGTFTAWAILDDDWSFVVTNAQLGETIDIEAQSIDTAGHASGVMTASVVVQPTPAPGDLDPIQAPPGPSTADIMVDVDGDLDGQSAGPAAGIRVMIERQSDGATFIDDADGSGMAEFADREPGIYTVRKLGVPGAPEVDTPNTQVTAVAHAATTAAIPIRIRKVCDSAGSLPGFGAYCDLNAAERGFILTHSPYYSIQFLLAARKAIQKTVAMFNGGDSPELDGTKANAFQHAYWTALMVRRAYNAPCTPFPPTCGDFPSFAWDYANAHESDDLNSSDPGTRQRAQMDEHNNYVGYSFADRREENRNSDKRLCEGMRSAVWGGILNPTPRPLRLYWLRQRDSNNAWITDPPTGPSVCS